MARRPADSPPPLPADDRTAGHSEVLPEPPEPHHRNIQGGTARAAVFGISDGLVSNVALILGVAAAHPAAGFVRLAGLAGLIGGSVSMAAGEFVSMTAQKELLERELEMERLELKRRPDHERRELVQLYRSRGIEAAVAEDLAEALMRDPKVALETHAREELGIHPESLGAPVAAAVSSFLAFSAGALIPLLPWFFATGTAAIIVSMVLGVVSALVVGAALASFTGRPVVRSAGRQLLWSAVPAAVTYVIGSAVGVGTA
ncbi:MAG TPA: VIT1/CCC1 transporter family protein [Acidimicrobiales bacterium]|jgi:VIT1/CCC1 family predicted Fe2+/Mn2+ transporter|nr:VIT1/CCC1 transporter family protein [Acidimicrobiales bacterium]